MTRRRIFETAAERVLLGCAFASILSVLFITVFIFQRGAPLFRIVSLPDFLFSTNWQPTAEVGRGFGILSFIVGSLFVTGLSIVLGLPIGLACGVFLAEIARGKLASALRAAVELLAGIPSVVYGFFGVVVICSLVRQVFGGTGFNVLSASIVLAIMILPTFVSITEASVRAVPRELREASYAIGATRWQTITRVLVPAASPGVIAGIVLGTGRAVGETMAVLMVGGNAPIMPNGPLSKVRTLTMNMVTDMGYASGDHLTALFTTGIVLFVFIMLLNIATTAISRRALRGKA